MKQKMVDGRVVAFTRVDEEWYAKVRADAEANGLRRRRAERLAALRRDAMRKLVEGMIATDAAALDALTDPAEIEAYQPKR